MALDRRAQIEIAIEAALRLRAQAGVACEIAQTRKDEPTAGLGSQCILAESSISFRLACAAAEWNQDLELDESATSFVRSHASEFQQHDEPSIFGDERHAMAAIDPNAIASPIGLAMLNIGY